MTFNISAAYLLIEQRPEWAVLCEIPHGRDLATLNRKKHTTDLPGMLTAGDRPRPMESKRCGWREVNRIPLVGGRSLITRPPPGPPRH